MVRVMPLLILMRVLLVVLLTLLVVLLEVVVLLSFWQRRGWNTAWQAKRHKDALQEVGQILAKAL